MFAEVTGEKLVSGEGGLIAPYILNRAKFTLYSNFFWSGNVEVLVCKLYKPGCKLCFYFGRVWNFGQYFLMFVSK